MNQLVARTAEAVRLEVPAEVATAAAQRSARIPGPGGIAAAWRGLPVDTQDRIGTLAVSVAFNSWLWMDESQEPAERWLTDAATQAADAQAERDYGALMRTIEGSVPALFGPDGEDPAWSTGTPLAAPSPIRAAIALHRAAWSTLQARATFLSAAAWTDRKEVSWPEGDAEAEAFGDLFLVSCRDRAEARILVDHLAWYEAVRRQHPRQPEMPEHVVADIAVRRADLALILGEPGAELPGGGLAAGIGAHRVAWTAYLTAPDKADDHDAWLVVWDAAIAAAEVVLRMPCAGRDDAEALVRHVGWYEAEVAAIGEDRTDGLTCGLRQLTARAGDLMLVTAESARRHAA